MQLAQENESLSPVQILCAARGRVVVDRTERRVERGRLVPARSRTAVLGVRVCAAGEAAVARRAADRTAIGEPEARLRNLARHSALSRRIHTRAAEAVGLVARHAGLPQQQFHQLHAAALDGHDERRVPPGQLRHAHLAARVTNATEGPTDLALQTLLEIAPRPRRQRPLRELLDVVLAC